MPLLAPSLPPSGSPLAFLCSMYSLIKSEFSSIWSSVIPIPSSSPKIPLHEGSTVSSDDALSRFGLTCARLTGSRGGIIDCGCGGGTWGEDDDLWLWPPCNRFPIPPNRLCDFPFARPPPPADCPPAPWKGVARVSLLAFFSRSSIFFLNCLASFSFTNEKPARHSSSSKEWKNVLSWL